MKHIDQIRQYSAPENKSPGAPRYKEWKGTLLNLLLAGKKKKKQIKYFIIKA